MIEFVGAGDAVSVKLAAVPSVTGDVPAVTDTSGVPAAATSKTGDSPYRRNALVSGELSVPPLTGPPEPPGLPWRASSLLFVSVTVPRCAEGSLAPPAPVPVQGRSSPVSDGTEPASVRQSPEAPVASLSQVPSQKSV